MINAEQVKTPCEAAGVGMTAKEYLEQAVTIRRRIYRIKQRCNELTAKLGYHPLQLDDSGASKVTVTDKVGYTLAELADWSKEYENEVFELKKKLDEISNLVERIDNVKYSEVLNWRYLVENKENPCKKINWITIAYKMKLPNENAAWAMHRRALKEFEKIFARVR